MMETMELIKKLYERYDINPKTVKEIIEYYAEEEDEIRSLRTRFARSTVDSKSKMCVFSNAVIDLCNDIHRAIKNSKNVSILLTEYYYWDTIEGILNDIFELKKDVEDKLRLLLTLERRLIALLKVKVGEVE